MTLFRSSAAVRRVYGYGLGEGCKEANDGQPAPTRFASGFRDDPADGSVSTFALIPGAGGAAWYWHRVEPHLQRAGHGTIAIDLPGDDEGAGLPEYTRRVVDAIEGRDDLVLVAQSLGGFTAPLVAFEVPVSAVVLVNAMIPAPGETPGAWWENTGSLQARERAAQRHGYDTRFDLDVYFLHDVPRDVVAAGAEHQRDEAIAVFGSVCDFEAWPAVPIRVVAGADDRFFPVEFQQEVARERLGIDPDVLPGGHLIALSQPSRLAQYRLLPSNREP
jgi:pimeloyl-ACP methyl ester carboxylesterase